MNERKIYKMRDLRAVVESEIAFRVEQRIDAARITESINDFFAIDSGINSISILSVVCASLAKRQGKSMGIDPSDIFDYGFSPNYVDSENMLSLMYKIPFIHPGILCDAHFVEFASQLVALSYLAENEFVNNQARGITKLAKQSPLQFAYFLINSICEKMLKENQSRNIASQNMLIESQRRLSVDSKRVTKHPYTPSGNAPVRRRLERKAFYDYLEIIASCPDCCQRALNENIEGCIHIADFGTANTVYTRGVAETQVIIDLENVSNLVTYLCRTAYMGLEDLISSQMNFITNSVSKRTKRILDLQNLNQFVPDHILHMNIETVEPHKKAMFLSEHLYGRFTQLLDDIYSDGTIFRYSLSDKIAKNLFDQGEWNNVIVPEIFSGKTLPTFCDGVTSPLLSSGVLYARGIGSLFVLIAERNLGYEFGLDFDWIKQQSVPAVVRRCVNIIEENKEKSEHLMRSVYCIVSSKLGLFSSIKSAIRHKISLIEKGDVNKNLSSFSLFTVERWLRSDKHFLAEQIIKHYETYGDLP